MKKTALITGINGFVGKHLSKELNSQNWIVDGVVREASIDKDINELVSDFHRCDLADEDSVKQLDLSPYHTIINLAGLANIADSFKSPEHYMRINVGVLTNICQRIKAQGIDTRVIAISSGAVYDTTQPLPLREGFSLAEASSPYAESKIAMEHAATQFRSQGLDVIVARPFNHIGPGQALGFLIPDLTAQVRSALSTGLPVKVGNLKTRRDYTDVRDVVKAYAKLAQEDLRFDTYNICSGRSLTGEKVLTYILDNLDKERSVIVEVDSSLIRPNDAADIVGSFERLNNDTGWEPAIPIEKTIKDYIDSL